MDSRCRTTRRTTRMPPSGTGSRSSNCSSPHCPIDGPFAAGAEPGHPRPPTAAGALANERARRDRAPHRTAVGAPAAVAHPIGLQAQAPFAPYCGLWSRLDGFTGEDLSGLLLSRKAVRIVLMRGTIHLVTANDCNRLRPLVQPALERMLRTNATHGKPLAAVDVTGV